MTAPSTLALCVTCLVDQVLPEVGLATARLLQRAGFTVHFPPEQTCCGQPFYNSGFRPQAADLARRTLALFEPYPAVVLPSGSCAAMLRVEYPHLLADDPAWAGRARALAAKTYELSDFLLRFAPDWLARLAASAPTSRRITYHDSCHMRRLLGLQAEPRAALTAGGCAIQEMAGPERCCGFGGLFSLRLPEVANAMTAARLRQAQAAGVAELITADPGCLIQLRGLAGPEMTVTHLATVLEEASR